MALLGLAACATPPAPETLITTPVAFADLPGWTRDHVSAAIPPLRLSCRALTQKPGKAWAAPCAAAAALPPDDDEAARRFFESWFQPYATATASGSEGLFTGYYEAELHGTWQRQGRYQTPLYARPSDLVTVDLGAFSKEWKGRHLAGKVDKNRLVPYDDRTAIDQGSLAGRATPLLWVDDPVDAFFLAIQGSGRVHMTDGRTVRVGYDGTNGRAYVAIGRRLAETAAIPRPVTMRGIRDWLNAHPDRAARVMDFNESYVFFRLLTTDAPIGAEGVPLTPERSLAVDPRFIALGTPLWLNLHMNDNDDMQHLVIAQDTGGAIRGPLRGDFFWGFGPQAEQAAGSMQNQGTYYILLPRPHQAPSAKD